ncbi:hypothetical protein BC829DRAFT_442953 [Chytridium lagenaria]|nr:hypothetical protein BC829DRAFT_442953 [Chytridium lagenaria]
MAAPDHVSALYQCLEMSNKLRTEESRSLMLQQDILKLHHEIVVLRTVCAAHGVPAHELPARATLSTFAPASLQGFNGPPPTAAFNGSRPMPQFRRDMPPPGPHATPTNNAPLASRIQGQQHPPSQAMLKQFHQHQQQILIQQQMQKQQQQQQQQQQHNNNSNNSNYSNNSNNSNNSTATADEAATATAAAASTDSPSSGT